MDLCPAVSRGDVVVNSASVLVLRSELLGQVSSVRCVACPKAQHQLGLLLLPQEAVCPCRTQAEGFDTWSLAGGC